MTFLFSQFGMTVGQGDETKSRNPPGKSWKWSLGAHVTVFIPQSQRSRGQRQQGLVKAKENIKVEMVRASKRAKTQEMYLKPRISGQGQSYTKTIEGVAVPLLHTSPSRSEGMNDRTIWIKLREGYRFKYIHWQDSFITKVFGTTKVLSLCASLLGGCSLC